MDEDGALPLTHRFPPPRKIRSHRIFFGVRSRPLTTLGVPNAFFRLYETKINHPGSQCPADVRPKLLVEAMTQLFFVQTLEVHKYYCNVCTACIMYCLAMKTVAVIFEVLRCSPCGAMRCTLKFAPPSLCVMVVRSMVAAHRSSAVQAFL